MSAEKIKRGMKLFRVAAYVTSDGLDAKIHEVVAGEAEGKRTRYVSWENSVASTIHGVIEQRTMEKPFARILGADAAKHGMLMIVTAYTLDKSKTDRLRAKCEREAVKQAHAMRVAWDEAAAKCPIADDVKEGKACRNA